MALLQMRDQQMWDRLVRRLPGHGIYQAWSWGALREDPSREVHRYALLRGGRPRAAASIEVRRLRRLPWRIAYCPGGPVWDAPEDLVRFSGELAAHLRRIGVLHLKVIPQAREGAEAALRTSGFVPVERPDLPFGAILPKRTMRLDLAQGLEGLRAAMEPEARRRVRQAARRGLRVDASDDPGAVLSLHAWLRSTAERKGFTVPSAHGLLSLAQAWLRSGEGVLLQATHEGSPVGAALVTFFGDEAFGHFLSDDERMRHLAAVYALYDAGLAHAVSRGCRFFDLGGVRDREDDGLYRFKAQFGAQPCTHPGEWNLPLQPLLYAALARVTRGGFARSV